MVVLRPALHRKLLGFGALFVGVVGLILPFLPGWLFIGLGVWLLRDQFVWAARLVARIRAHWPQAIPALEDREQRILAWLDRRLAPLRRIFGGGRVSAAAPPPAPPPPQDG